jgi:hypothetical protein
MKRTTFAALAAVSILTLALMAGCSSGSGAKTTGSSTAQGGATSEPTYAEPYPTITPESANEKKAAASTQAALQGYIDVTKAGNKQNKTDNAIFDNKEGYKPRFVGYQFTLLGPKRADGQYAQLTVCAFDGGKQIKPISVWESFGSVEVGDGTMTDTWYNGVSSPSDPAVYTVGITPESASEKAATAAVEAWAKKNTKAGAFDKTLLVAYLFVWGEVQGRPNMMMAINADGFSTGSMIAWGEQK